MLGLTLSTNQSPRYFRKILKKSPDTENFIANNSTHYIFISLRVSHALSTRLCGQALPQIHSSLAKLLPSVSAFHILAFLPFTKSRHFLSLGIPTKSLFPLFHKSLIFFCFLDIIFSKNKGSSIS